MGEMVDRWRGAGQGVRRPDLGGIGIDAPVSPKPGIGVDLVRLELRRRLKAINKLTPPQRPDLPSVTSKTRCSWRIGSVATSGVRAKGAHPSLTKSVMYRF
jgi:hypothetical protein